MVRIHNWENTWIIRGFSQCTLTKYADDPQSDQIGLAKRWYIWNGFYE